MDKAYLRSLFPWSLLWIDGDVVSGGCTTTAGRSFPISSSIVEYCVFWLFLKLGLDYYFKNVLFSPVYISCFIQYINHLNDLNVHFRRGQFVRIHCIIFWINSVRVRISAIVDSVRFRRSGSVTLNGWSFPGLTCPWRLPSSNWYTIDKISKIQKKLKRKIFCKEFSNRTVDCFKLKWISYDVENKFTLILLGWELHASDHCRSVRQFPIDGPSYSVEPWIPCKAATWTAARPLCEAVHQVEHCPNTDRESAQDARRAFRPQSDKIPESFKR